MIDQRTEQGFIEADLVAMQIEQMLEAPTQMNQPKNKTSNKELVPLFGGGGGNSPEGDEGWVSSPDEMLNQNERRESAVQKSEAE